MFLRAGRPSRKRFEIPPDILSASMIYGTCYLETEIVKHKVRFSYQVQSKAAFRKTEANLIKPLWTGKIPDTAYYCHF